MNTNNAAFPADGTLRDYIAIHAPEPFINADTAEFVSGRSGVPMPDDIEDQQSVAEFWMRCEAVMRYRYADIMLAERERQS